MKKGNEISVPINKVESEARFSFSKIKTIANKKKVNAIIPEKVNNNAFIITGFSSNSYTSSLVIIY